MSGSTTTGPAVGDLLQTPGLTQRILEVDWRKDDVLTRDGRRWCLEELEPVPMPADPRQLQAWLGGPTLRVRDGGNWIAKVETVLCKPTCNCTHCYCGAQMNYRDETVASHHFVNNDHCRCVADECACIP